MDLLGALVIGERTTSGERSCLGKVLKVCGFSSGPGPPEPPKSAGNGSPGPPRGRRTALGLRCSRSGWSTRCPPSSCPGTWLMSNIKIPPKKQPRELWLQNSLGLKSRPLTCSLLKGPRIAKQATLCYAILLAGRHRPSGPDFGRTSTGKTP